MEFYQQDEATYGIVYETYSFLVFGDFYEITTVFDDAIDYQLIEKPTKGKIYTLSEASAKFYDTKIQRYYSKKPLQSSITKRV